MLLYWLISQCGHLSARLFKFYYVYQDLIICIKIYLSISRFIYKHQVSYISVKIRLILQLHQDPYTSRL